MVTMAARVFVDTNVLLRFSFPGLNFRKECRDYVAHLMRNGSELWISNQVIREFYVQATHANTFSRPLTTTEVLRVIELFPLHFHIAESAPAPAVRAELLVLLHDYDVRGKLTHDTNILATMLTHDIDTICTLDSDFNRFTDRVTILRPRANPA